MSLAASGRRALSRVRAWLRQILVPDAGRVLARAWSVWLGALAAAVIIADATLPAFEEALGLPPRAALILAALLQVSAIGARVLLQRTLSGGDHADR